MVYAALSGVWLSVASQVGYTCDSLDLGPFSLLVQSSAFTSALPCLTSYDMTFSTLLDAGGPLSIGRITKILGASWVPSGCLVGAIIYDDHI